MVSGVPTLAPRSGGVLSYATDDNAWLVEPTGRDFADAVEAIVADPDEARRRTANAVATALENTREKSTDNLFAAYDRMWADFQERHELYCSIAETKRFDYTTVAPNRDLLPEER
jgi:glycosyltransferase involved in cell wall biosynthesis